MVRLTDAQSVRAEEAYEEPVARAIRLELARQAREQRELEWDWTIDEALDDAHPDAIFGAKPGMRYGG